MIQRTIERLFSPRSVATFWALDCFTIGAWAFGDGSVDALQHSLQPQAISIPNFETVPDQQDYAYTKMGMGVLLMTSAGATAGVMMQSKPKQ